MSLKVLILIYGRIKYSTITNKYNKPFSSTCSIPIAIVVENLMWKLLCFKLRVRWDVAYDCNIIRFNDTLTDVTKPLLKINSNFEKLWKLNQLLLT